MKRVSFLQMAFYTLFYFLTEALKIKLAPLIKCLYLSQSAADVTHGVIPEMKDKFPHQK